MTPEYSDTIDLFFAICSFYLKAMPHTHPSVRQHGLFRVPSARMNASRA